MINNSTILVAEKEQYLQDIIIRQLHRQGYQAIGVATGERALYQAQTIRPHLLIIDPMLPDINSIDVCRRIKQDNELQAIGIIITSVKNEEKDIIGGLDLGADDYITKPFSIHVLLARVRAVLHRSRFRAQEVI